jgi:GGDEF domain-containing protein
MDAVAAGFWGAFFGMATLVFAVAFLAFQRSMRGVARIIMIPPAVLVLFVAVHLGWFPVEGAALARLQAHTAVAASAGLSIMMLALLGILRRPRQRRLGLGGILGAGALALGAGWFTDAGTAHLIGTAGAFAIGLSMLPIATVRVVRGEPLAWVAVAGLWLTLTTLAGLSWTARHPPGHWGVHAVSASFAVAYLILMAVALWTRFSYLLELSRVIPQGTEYDPVTRMRSHSETGQMVAEFFARRGHPVRAIGVVAVSIGNLYALENLHGRAAFNHALFVCAGRLRRCVPMNVEMGRLGEDGFLLLVADGAGVDRLAVLARSLRDRLSRPIVLGTGLQTGRTEWAAEVGVGVLSADAPVRASEAVARVRAVSRSAWGFPSRLACYDMAARRIEELRVPAQAA